MILDLLQFLALASLLIASGGLVVAFTNLQTSRLSSLVEALTAVRMAEQHDCSEKIASLQGEVNYLRKEVAGLRKQVEEVTEENRRLLNRLAVLLEGGNA